jgi:hypothetical protein
MAQLTDYIQLPLEARQQHLQTEAPCNGTERISPKRLLSALGIDNDCSNWLKARVTIGYCCPHGCSNPAHAFLCRPDERRADHSARLRARLAPYADSTLSDREVARLASTSPASVRKYRHEAGIGASLRQGADGKTYARGEEAKAVKRLREALETAATLLEPKRVTPEVRQLVAALSELATTK